MLQRLVDQLDRPTIVGAPPHDSGEVAAAFDDLVATVDGLVGKLDALENHEDDVEAGVQHQCVVATRVRTALKEKRAPSPKPSPASTRMQRRSPDPTPLDLGGVKFGVVKSWDQRTWTGSMVCGGEEIIIPTRAVRLAGLTNLFAGQRCEFTIVLGPDGRRREAENLKLVYQDRVAAGMPR
jgi:cold shock CspA family protein